MSEEFEFKINSRDTIIRYNDNVNIKELLIQIDKYRKINRWKLKTFAIKNYNYTIIDKEYKQYRDNNDNNTKLFFDNNQVYVTEKTFKPKGKIRRTVEKLLIK